MNPYSGQTFFEFFGVLLSRFLQIGQVEIASDEVQIVVLVGVALSSALVGTFLVLRKMTMLANALSHTILLGVVFAFLLFQGVLAMLLASLAMALLTVFATQLLLRFGSLPEDASIGIVFTTFFALGIVAVTLLTKNTHIGVEAVMGNVDALHVDDCRLVLVVLGLNVLLTFLFFKEYQLTTFDAGFAMSLGFSPIKFNYLLMIQTSATAIAAFRAVGVLMVLAFITGPVLTAYLFTHRLKTLLLGSCLVGSCTSLIGVALSRHILSVYGTPVSTGGLIVCLLTVVYVIALSLKAVADSSTKSKAPSLS